MRFLSSLLSIFLIPLVAVIPMKAETGPLEAAGAPIPVTSTPATPATTLQIRLADPGKAVVEANSFIKGFAIQVTDASGLAVPEVAVALRLPEEGATGFFVDGARSAVAYTNAAGIATFAQVNWGSTVGTVEIRVTAVKGDLHAGALIEQTIVARNAGIPQAQAAVLKVTSPAAVPESTAPAAKATASTPGTPASVASVRSGATAEETGMRTTETAASVEPTVSIVNTAGSKGTHSNKKWILIALVAVGAGVGAALAMSGKGGSTAAPAAGTTIGTPTVSIGH